MRMKQDSRHPHVFSWRQPAESLLIAHCFPLIAIFMNGHHLKLLKELSENNSQSQRELSQKLGLSRGSVNYVLSHLVDHVHPDPCRDKK